MFNNDHYAGGIGKTQVAKTLNILILPLLLVFSCLPINAQHDNEIAFARELISARGEVIIKFALPDEYSLSEFVQHLSPDKIKDDTIYAYANEEQLNWFLLKNISFKVIPPVKVPKLLSDNRKSTHTMLNHYPSYDEYIRILESYANDYQHLCVLQQFGTTVNGHKLLALKISDNPSEDEAEPVFFYSSSLHGDEAAGFILLIRLIDSLLTTYSENVQFKQMIDNAEIWINPLSNPDGFYYDSDSLYFNSKRFNANNIDLNRNFPDPVAGDHPDGQEWQPETVALMNFMKQQKITLAANLHDGAELVNYPWDCRYERHPDDGWYWQISRQYADTVHKYSTTGFFTELNNGITNGFDWYQVYGGKQDYVNYFLHAREVTIELSEVKSPPHEQLSALWNYHKRSLIDYIQQIFTGIHGFVSDAVTGEPVEATIEIPGHDHDNSQVFSSPGTGEFYRLTNLDSCTLMISAPGYITQFLKIDFSGKELVNPEISLMPSVNEFALYPNPFSDILNIILPVENEKQVTVVFYDIFGRKVHAATIPVQGRVVSASGLNKLGNGIYLVSISCSSGVFKSKLLKIR